MSARSERELYSPAVESATKKAMTRLVPFLLLMYIIAFIDRTNIGFAEESFELDHGISTAAYAFGAGLFFVGYAVFEVPSNLIMHKVGARWWMARIMITWGIVAALFMFVNGTAMFYILRFLLGVTEAGFFPGVVMYLTYWFPQRKRGRAMSLFYIGMPIANTIGNPLSGALLELDGVLGLRGYQWMFMLEGLMAIIIGFVVFVALTDRPSKAKWLSAEERTALTQVIDNEESEKQEVAHLNWWEALVNGRVLYFCLWYFMIQVAVYGLTFFLPKQISAVTGQSIGFVVGLVAAIPWFCGVVGSLIVGRLADRSGRYRDWSASMLVVSGIGLILCATVTNNPYLSVFALCLGAIGFVSAQPVYWNVPTSYLSGAALASGVGMINGLGNVGGFVAPNLRVAVVDQFGGESAGLVMLGVAGLLGAALGFGSRVFDRADKKKALQASL